MDVQEAIRTKRAVRKFKDRLLPEDAINTILNAGRRAQSAKNTQPWQFIAVQDKDLLLQLSKTGTYAGHLAGAALGVFILTPDPSIGFTITFDAGQAAAYMQLAAWDLGIGSVLASIYQPDDARQLLGFPDALQAHIALSFGYPENEDLLTAQPRKGGRQPLEDIVHWNHW